MAAGDSDHRSLFEHLFKVASYIFRPHFRRKHFPEGERSLAYWIEHWVHYFGVWFVLLVVYGAAFYVFGIESKEHWWQRITHFYHVPPATILHELYVEIKRSFWFNALFLFVMRSAVSAISERDFLLDYVVHFKLSGLIKVIRIGNFNSQCWLIEVNRQQLNLARRNIQLILEPDRIELVSIVAASGWDFFGDGPSLPAKKKPDHDGTATNTKIVSSAKSSSPGVSEKKDTKGRVIERLSDWLRKRNLLVDDIDNGFLLDLVSRRNRRVEVVLLDPESPAARERGNAYCKKDAHQAVKSADDYLAAIRHCITKLQELQKKNPNLELRLSAQVPPVKMLLIEGEAWVQSIIPGMRSDHTPLYGFKKSENSLYNLFFNLNEQFWHSSKPAPIYE